MSYPEPETAEGESMCTVADFYDSDYPALGVGPLSNWDEPCLASGVASDTAWYAGVLLGNRSDRRRGDATRVLDVGAGTGRLASALAQVGALVTAVEPSDAMRIRLASRFRRTSRKIRSRVRIFERIQVVPREPTHDSAALLFGVLTTVPDLDAQIDLLREIQARLRRGGVLALDVPSPIGLRATAARPSWIRRHPNRGTRYARVAGATALDADQRIRIFGVYEEEGSPSRAFSIVQRLLFPGELRLMLERAGFEVLQMSGDVHGGPVGAGSRMYTVAQKRGRSPAATAAWIPPAPTGAAATALVTAAARARHMEHAEIPEVVDPYALRLAGATGLSLFAELGGMELIGPTIARGRWFDDRVQEAALAGARTVISLGAGLCTRPYRLSTLRTRQIVEIDVAEILRYKDALLADQPRPARLETSVLDLASTHAPDAVAALLRTVSSPIAVVAEGLLPYLPPERADALLKAILNSLPAKSAFFVDAQSRGVSPGRVAQALSARGVRWHDPPSLLDGPLPTSLSRVTTHVGAADACHGGARSETALTLLHTIRRGGGF